MPSPADRPHFAERFSQLTLPRTETSIGLQTDRTEKSMAIEASNDDWSLTPFSLAGQNALVTGAGSGIGKATARLLAATGAKVVVSDLVADSARSVVQEIEAAGGQALAVTCDVSDEAQVTEAFRQADSWFGAPDVLVNVAAWRKKHETLTMSVEQWDIMHAVIARGTYLCIRNAVPRMRDSGRGGAIVNVSSVAAERPVVFDSIDYDSAKAGVNAITRAAAAEFARYGVRVNAIMPGATNRPGAPDLGGVRPTGPFTMPGRMPMKRIAEPIEQARAVLFLASPAASYISGVCIAVDGAGLLS
jgi:NAD(P)-dependent dehydrogenase (short-subunit alcohol dehydrogenase family)